MNSTLSALTISELYAGRKSLIEQPILQVIEILGPGKMGGIKVSLYDGSHFCEATVPRKENLINTSVIKVNKFSPYKASEQKFLIQCNEIDVISSQLITGSPVNIIPNGPKFVLMETKSPLTSSSSSQTPTLSQPSLSSSSSLSQPSLSSLAAPAKFPERKENNPLMIVDLVMGKTRDKIVKVKVVNKTEVKEFKNGKGIFFSADFADEKGELLKATFFTDECNVWNSYIQKGQVYLSTGFTIKKANATYTKAKWEMNVDSDTRFQQISSEIKIPFPKFNVKKIADIKKCNQTDILDIIGVIIEVQEYNTSSSSGKEVFRRLLTIADETNHSIPITIWGRENKEMFEMSNCMHKILAVKDCRINYFNGNVSLSSSKQFYLDHTKEQIPEIAPISEWLLATDIFGLSESCQKITSIELLESADMIKGGTSRKLEEVKSLKPDDNKNEYSIVFANVTKFEYENKSSTSNLPSWYILTCPECKKKLNAQNFCESCAKMHKVDALAKYSLRVEISDHTSGIPCSIFGDQAERLLGIKVEQMIELDNDKTRKEFNEVFSGKNIGKSYKFKIQSRTSVSNERAMVWHSINECFPCTF
jgi:hypothetical protein